MAPPIDEQSSIVKDVDARCRILDEANRAVELAMSRLNEYRSALISAAVTGKIDVRNT